mgnify:CR=1 FL=1
MYIHNILFHNLKILRLINDNSCVWINQLQARNNTKILSANLICDYLIVGAGYTGLSAARKLGHIRPDQKILLVDSQLAGDGASGRNSGYLVDTTLNDGFTSNNELEIYKKKTDIYELGINAVKRFIKELKNGNPVLIFPEGQRSTDGEILPGEAGVGLVIAKSKAPVLPIRIFGCLLYTSPSHET